MCKEAGLEDYVIARRSQCRASLKRIIASEQENTTTGLRGSLFNLFNYKVTSYKMFGPVEDATPISSSTTRTRFAFMLS